MPPSETPRILRLTLRDFRNHAAFDLPLSRGMVALSGPNGAGKTNVLEALSLFAQGRGLRRAEFADMARLGTGAFIVSLEVGDTVSAHRLGTNYQRDAGAGRGERLCRVDGLTAPSASAFAEHLRLVWLTPDLDGLFRDTPGERRRFLDRLVLAVDASHAARVSALERALRTRNRLLEDGNTRWLDAAERELAELAVAVAEARRETAGRLDAELLAHADSASPFPVARLSLDGAFEEMGAGRPALDQEDAYRAALRESRPRDAAAGRTLFGPQATDLAVRHGPKDMRAALCSTGEQKALLLRLVLAHARLVERMSGLAPLLLLDEVAAHLDPERRSALFGELAGFGAQVWMTGADPALFAELEGRADLVRIGEG